MGVSLGTVKVRFELWPAARRLFADGRDVRLGADAFVLLQALFERGDRIVDKDGLLELARPGMVVEESNLTGADFGVCR